MFHRVTYCSLSRVLHTLVFASHNILITLSSFTLQNTDYLNRIKDEQYSLIRMLYCYILPKVELVNKDLSKVQEAIGRQTASIQKIDTDIEEDSKKLLKFYQDLQNHQDKHLDEFTELFETKKCTKEFIKTFDTDLNKRIHRLNEEVID